MFSGVFFSVLFIFGVSLGFARKCSEDRKESYSYDDSLPNGPNSWGNSYPMCNGNMQSPINIVKRDAETDRRLDKLKLKNYNKPITRATMSNDGHTVTVVPQDGVARSFKINDTTYNLQSFHWHWGASEHKINDNYYTMELHLVHMNSQKQIAVIGVLYQKALFDNGGMKPIVETLSEVKYKNQTTQLASNVYLEKLVDNECEFYRYNGSLTTPPCSQGVIWTVCKDAKSIENSKVKQFKELYSTTTNRRGCQITNNYRPIQPLNGRKVLSTRFHIL